MGGGDYLEKITCFFVKSLKKRGGKDHHPPSAIYAYDAIPPKFNSHCFIQLKRFSVREEQPWQIYGLLAKKTD